MTYISIRSDLVISDVIFEYCFISILIYDRYLVDSSESSRVMLYLLANSILDEFDDYSIIIPVFIRMKVRTRCSRWN